MAARLREPTGFIEPTAAMTIGRAKVGLPLLYICQEIYHTKCRGNHNGHTETAPRSKLLLLPRLLL